MKEDNLKLLHPPSGNVFSHLFASTMVVLCLLLFQKILIEMNHKFYRMGSIHSKESSELIWQISSPSEEVSRERKFVEANPTVAINPPDETLNFSFQDQQAAQPSDFSPLEKKDLPEVEGMENTVKIVSPKEEVLSETETSSFPGTTIEPSPLVGETVGNNQKPITRLSKNENEIFSENDGIQILKNVINAKDEKMIDLTRQDSLSSEIVKISPSLDPVVLKQAVRPKLSPDLIRGPLMQSSESAPRIGSLAIECKMHPYGVYVQEMLQSIEEQWHHLTEGSMRYLKKDQLPSKITYRFSLLTDGTIRDLRRIDEQNNELPAEICRQAIASRVPFGQWSEKMIRDFGKSDEVTITFSYN